MEADHSGLSHDHSDAYGVGETIAAVGGALVLIIANITLMILIAPTSAAEFVIWTYEAAPGAPWFGLILMSAILSIGRFVSYTSLGFNAYEPADTTFPGDINPGLAAIGLGVTMVAFGLFGGAALSIVDPALRTTVLGIAIAATAVITFAAGGLELLTERSLAPYGRMLMTGGMFGGIGLLAVAYVLDWIGVGFAGWLYLAAFGLILLGWIGDLIHEIAVLTRDDRSVLVNAYGLYAAVTGVLVHILWIVAKAYADG